jgi:hypothetical protein
MGTDINIRAERKIDGVWTVVEVSAFDCRSYGVFGFLANVRNYSRIPPIAELRGLPNDCSVAASDWLEDCHSTSWLSIAELLAFDYDQTFEDRRTSKTIGNVTIGNHTAEPGGGKKMTIREFLGERFFEDLGRLQQSGAERIVFGFDS